MLIDYDETHAATGAHHVMDVWWQYSWEQDPGLTTYPVYEKKQTQERAQ